MVREIRGAKVNPKSSFKNQGAQNTRGRKLREQIRYITPTHDLHQWLLLQFLVLLMMDAESVRNL